MQEKNLWKQFTQTGSIKDYLQYCKVIKEEEKKPEAVRQDEWVESNAGLYIGDGHGNQGGTNWGIR